MVRGRSSCRRNSLSKHWGIKEQPAVFTSAALPMWPEHKVPGSQEEKVGGSRSKQAFETGGLSRDVCLIWRGFIGGFQPRSNMVGFVFCKDGLQYWPPWLGFHFWKISWAPLAQARKHRPRTPASVLVSHAQHLQAGPSEAGRTHSVWGGHGKACFQ